jgi:hypothetical protein
MRFSLKQSILVVILLSIVTSYMVYFGYQTHYSGSIFKRQTFTTRYTTDVFKYRVLSRELLLHFDDAIDPDGKAFYVSVFYVNTIFLILTSILAVLLIDLKGIFNATPGEKTLIVFLIPLVINLSQFCIVPYDISSYFFQLLILWLFFRLYEKNYILSLFSIAVILALSTANRESSALSLAALILMLVLRYGFVKRSLISIGILIISFLATYVLLRVMIKGTGGPEMGISPLAGDLTAFVNILGILFWLIFFYLTIALANTLENRCIVVAFHILSLPYIYTILTVGILWEVRLYVPLFLHSIYFSKLNTEGYLYKLEPYYQKMKAYVNEKS